MDKDKKQRVRYDYKYLKNFCFENELEILKDYSNILITRESLIDIRCIEENCENVCSKRLRELVKNKNFRCKNCSLKFKVNKIKNTCINKYGVCTPLQASEIKDKVKKTMLEKYGVEHPMQCEKIKEQYKNTCIKKFGVINPTLNLEIKEKVKNTCIKKFGVENPFQCEIIKNKIKEYNVVKYGVECNSKSEELKNKYKQTCLEKYGSESHLQNEFIKQKIKQSNILKYDVENVMHNTEIMEKASKKAYKLKDYIFKSGKIIKVQGYEKFALDYLLNNENISENDILTGCKNVPTIWYCDKLGKLHRHYVDIFIPSQNKCIEVKSIWTAEKKKDCIYLKQDSAKKLGFNYEIWIYSKTGERIKTII